MEHPTANHVNEQIFVFLLEHNVNQIKDSHGWQLDEIPLLQENSLHSELSPLWPKYSTLFFGLMEAGASRWACWRHCGSDFNVPEVLIPLLAHGMSCNKKENIAMSGSWQWLHSWIRPHYNLIMLMISVILCGPMRPKSMPTL